MNYINPVQEAPTQKGSGSAMASFVIGVISILLSFLFIPQIVGCILGILGLKSEKRGFAIAGIVLNIITFVAGFFVLMVLLIAIPNIIEVVEEAKESAEFENSLRLEEDEGDLFEDEVDEVVTEEDTEEDTEEVTEDDTNKEDDDQGELLSEQEKLERLKKGYFIENQYINDYIGFSIDFPADWTIQGKEEIEQAMKDGLEMMEGNLDESDVNYDTLAFNIMASKYVTGTNQNPNITINAEYIGGTGISSEEDYINLFRQQIETYELEIEIEAAEEEVFGGAEFTSVNLVSNYSGIEITQKFYTKIIGDYIVNITLTYFDEGTFNETHDVLNTIEVK